jgi:hypothetical protein
MMLAQSDTMEALQAGAFTEELRRLALRYRPLPGTKATEAQHWGLPTQLKHAIMSKCKLGKERFSNPFVAHPCTPSYWTSHERDQVFGANHDAYTVRWTGASLAVPEFDVHMATKAVDWAITSAKSTTDSTLTILLLPTFYAVDATDTKDNASYMQLVRRNHDVCLPVCTFARESLQLEPPGCQPLDGPRVLKWKFRMLAVGNQAGLSEYFPFNVEGRRQASSWSDEFEKVVRDAVPANDSKKPPVTFKRLDDLHMIEDATKTHARWARKASKRFRKRPADTSSVMALPRPAGYQTPPRYIWASQGAGRIDSADAPLTSEELQAAHATAARTMRRTQSRPPPLAHDWEDFLYTDGSHVTGPGLEGPGIGAAVHVWTVTR